jgi:HPt (histidine-containing phosphotransfer) domain-containing protein
VTCALPLDDESFREIVEEFSVKLASQVEQMKLAYAAEDWDQLVELGHWLKGSGGTAGYEQFTIPSGRLERLAKEHRHEMIETVLNEIEQLTLAVAREMDSLPVLT